MMSLWRNEAPRHHRGPSSPTIVLLPIIKRRYQSAPLHRYKTTRQLSRGCGKCNMKVLLYFSPARARPFPLSLFLFLSRPCLVFPTRRLKEGLAPLDWTIKSLLTLQNCQPLPSSNTSVLLSDATTPARGRNAPSRSLTL